MSSKSWIQKQEINIFNYTLFRGVIFSFLFLLAACEPQEEHKVWVQTTAIVTEAETWGDGNYGYTIQYDALESTAVNAQGEPIKGPISQHGTSKNKLMMGQKLTIRYRQDEPTLFELPEPNQ